MQTAPVTVVETAEFQQRAQKLMDDGERAALMDCLARRPDAGDMIKAPAACENCDGLWKAEGKAAERA